MNITQLTPDTLEGIGAATQAALCEGNVEFVSDFLIYPTRYIHELVVSTSSLGQVETWRAMAILLQVEGMNPQWAEALVKAGVVSLERYLILELDELEQLFEDARAQGVISQKPTTAELFTITRSVSAIEYSAKAQGFVLDPNDEPVPEAKVRIGYHTATSNERGFWQIIGIDAGFPAHLTVVVDGYEDVIDNDVSLSTDDWTTAVRIDRLVPGTSEPKTFDEYNGDTLPGLSSYQPTILRFKVEDLRDNDTFVVHQLYRSSPDAKLVSLYRGFERGKLLIKAFKVPLDRFTAPVEKGMYFVYRNGVFAERDMTAALIDRLRGKRKRRLEIRSNHEPGSLSFIEYFELLHEDD